MSVAFRREEDIEAAVAHLPDRPISSHPNLVTATGLAQLDQALAAARTAYAVAQANGGLEIDRTAMARAARDLRYYMARRKSAQLVEPNVGSPSVAFGSTVTFDRDDGRRQTFRIVGEDEADPANGSISYASPLARTLLGKSVGEVAVLAGAEVAIIGVSW